MFPGNLLCVPRKSIFVTQSSVIHGISKGEGRGYNQQRVVETLFGRRIAIGHELPEVDREKQLVWSTVS